jgi:hypothetical protein
MIKKTSIKTKVIYFVSLLAMCALLVSTAYFFFLRTVDINVMEDIELIYTGENGLASVQVVAHTEKFDQRQEEFMKTITYSVEPNTDLANGDTITIRASFDKQMASDYHFNAINTIMETTVEGLYNRYASLYDIPQEYLDLADTNMSNWLSENQDKIYTSLFNYSAKKDLQMEQTLEYSAFLKSESDANNDKIVAIFKLRFLQDDIYREAYYLVCVPGINDSNLVEYSSIYGEKAYLSESESKSLDFASYISRMYESKYDVEMLYSINESA